MSVATVEAPEQLTALERAAIGRVGPRYNTRSRYPGGYLDLPADAQAKVDTLIGGEMVRAKVGGTYAVVSLGLPGTDIEHGEPLKTGRTKNLINRLTDHVRNTESEGALRTMLETEFPDAD